MNYSKSIFIFIFISISFLKSFGDGDDIDRIINALKERYPMPVLHKSEMYADFDSLVSIMERCNPQYLIRKKVTGYDLITEIKRQRVQIENCNNTSDFINLLKNILSLSLDEHCDIGGNVWFYQHSFYKKDIRINKITERDFGINFHYLHDIFYKNQPVINLIYIQGKYFLKNTCILFNDMDSTIIPAGTEIVSFNQQSIEHLQSSMRNWSSQWDFSKKVYYNSILYILNTQNNIAFNLNGGIKEYSFTKCIQKEKEWNPIKEHEFHIHWFAKDSVLYFKLPSMSYSFKYQQQFKEKVLCYRSKYIKYIIIDIRGNYGGNDKTWEELLRTIIKDTIKYHSCFLSNIDSDVSKRIRLKQKKGERVFGSVDTNYSFRVYDNDPYVVKSHKQNLNYEGTIFLLVDEDIYSSAMAFSSLCTKTNKVKTIGMPTGKIGGRGTTPSVFILPNSRLIFTIELFLDAAGVNTVEDFYHDKLTYPVVPSIDYYLYWYNPERGYEIDEKAMYEHDEIFLKALEIIKQEQK
jgi:hypothetical protein